MGGNGIIRLQSVEETFAFGAHVAKYFAATGAILALNGELGTGKTSFVQGLALGLGIDKLIQSPTFGYLNIHEGTCPLYHFDLYRMKGPADFFSMGFEESFDSGGIVAIEWAERLANKLPFQTIGFHFLHEKKERIVRLLSSLDRNLVELLSKWA